MSAEDSMTAACCSFCGGARGEGLVLVEAPKNGAYICGDCALKCTHLIFAHKRTLSHKLCCGLIPFLIFLALGLTLCWYFLEEDRPPEMHITAGLVLWGFLACYLWHFWWPDDDLLPRRPWLWRDR